MKFYSSKMPPHDSLHPTEPQSVSRDCIQTIRRRPTLQLLLPELLELIAQKLTCKDFCSVRCASKTLYGSTLHFFGTTYLSKIRTTLSKSSLQKLESLAYIESLRLYPQVLLFADDPPGQSSNCLGGGFKWERSPSGHLILDGLAHPAVAKLADLLVGRFENCRTFQFTGAYSFNTPYSHEWLMPTDLMQITFHIIASRCLPIHGFLIEFRNYGYSSAVGTIDQNRIHPDPFSNPAFCKSWAGIHDLSVEFILEVSNSVLVLNMVKLASPLRRLSLNFSQSQSNLVMHNLLDDPRIFRELESLRLESVELSRADLLEIFSRCSETLRSLTIVQVRINAQSGCWAAMLETMKTALPRMQYLRLLRPHQFVDEDLPQHKFIYFPLWETDPAPPTLEGGRIQVKRTKFWKKERRTMDLVYEGPKMDAALDFLARSIQVV